MNYIIIKKELHLSHLALIISKNNPFAYDVGEDKNI